MRLRSDRCGVDPTNTIRFIYIPGGGTRLLLVYWNVIGW
jgi:hypothetical protein